MGDDRAVSDGGLLPARVNHVAWARSGDLAFDALNGLERRHVASFFNPADGNRQATSYALRRNALSRLTGVAPADLQFVRRCQACGSTEHGAPRCLQAAPEYTIGVSSRGAIAVVAVGCDTAIGIDVEERIELRRWEELAALAAHPDDDPSLEPVQLWTAKEAALKAAGFGLYVPPGAVHVRAHGPLQGIAGIAHERLTRSFHVQWMPLDGMTCAVAGPSYRDTTLRHVREIDHLSTSPRNG